MGILSRGLFERKAADPLEVWAEMLRAGTSSKAGQTVNLETAFKVSVLFACLRVLSQGCAQVPFKLFQEREVNGLPKLLPAREHQVYDLLATSPNAWSTSFEFRETQVIHAALGNAYAFKVKGLDGRLLELILLDPKRVEKIQQDDWSIVYKLYGTSGSVQELPADAIWHLRGPSWNGLIGMDVLKIAREALGLAIATEESHARLHANGVKTAGIYSIDGKLSPQQYSQLRAWIEKEHVGAEKNGVPMILDNGAKWLTQAMTGVDSQHLETRKHQIEEVCRFIGVHPQKIYHTDKTSTYASAEEFANAHREDTLAPWYARIEQSADLHLLSVSDRRKGYYFKHVANALMRASAKDRADYYSKALGAGGGPAWMTQDEVRALEELNQLGGAASALPVTTNAPAQ